MKEASRTVEGVPIFMTDLQNISIYKKSN